MAQIISMELSELLLQAKYAPEEKRLFQIESCENLLRLIRPGGKYPYDFICFHLTGYHPRRKKTSNLIDYKDLCHDLPIYSEQLSRTLRITYASLDKKKVYTINRLTRRFNVCEKTINRWRRDGLVGRYVIFPDGRWRLVFLARTVDFFYKVQTKRVKRGIFFTQTNSTERQEIIRRLKRWAHFCPDQRQEAIRRTAKKFSRSVETIRKILIDYEKTIHPKQLFFKRSDYIDESKRNEIFCLFDKGMTIKGLMGRYGRTKSNIYRAINLYRASLLDKKQISYVYSDEFNNSESEKLIITVPEGLFANYPISVRENHAGFSEASDSRETTITAVDKPLGDLESYTGQITHTPVLGQKQEQFLFRKYNYLKYQACQLRSIINQKQPQGRIISRVSNYLEEADKIKELLIRSNLRLVVSIARKHTRRDMDMEMPELISEGNVALMNAIEKFDFTRGFKFSTYATWAIVKRYATLRAHLAKEQAQAIPDELWEVTEDLRVASSRVEAVESAHQSLKDLMEDALEEREKIVVQEHYGLGENEKIPGRRKPKSLREIAQLLGLSKERVRQIELAALQKLRRILSPEEFEVLVGW